MTENNTVKIVVAGVSALAATYFAYKYYAGNPSPPLVEDRKEEEEVKTIDVPNAEVASPQAQVEVEIQKEQSKIDETEDDGLEMTQVLTATDSAFFGIKKDGPELWSMNDELEKRLATYMWLGKTQPSSEDLHIADEIKSGARPMPTVSKHPNAFAWYSLISKFTSSRTAQFKQEPVPSSVIVEEDDDMDLFGSDEDEDEAKDIAAQLRGKAYEAKKTADALAKGKTLAIAKSLVLWEVKPVDDETDLDVLGKRIIEEITMDGLAWKTEFKKAPIAFGIYKLIIGATIEDAKVSTDDIEEKMQAMDDMVQSVDIQSFNKL